MVSGNDAHGEAGPEYWTTPNPCAEPMCEAAENLSHVLHPAAARCCKPRPQVTMLG